jgi:hypothetical protein
MSRVKWFGHAGHFILGHRCRFHLCTQVGKYLVSTVGELWHERGSREIHARIVDPAWFDANRHRLGDDFDAAYFKRFGYDAIGCDRKYETMVFKAGARCRPGPAAGTLRAGARSDHGMGGEATTRRTRPRQAAEAAALLRAGNGLG